MDELIELVSPEQLPEEGSTRFLLDGVAVEVEPEGAHSWWFPRLGVSLVQRRIWAGGTFVVSGHGEAGPFSEALVALRRIAQEGGGSVAGGSEERSRGGRP